MQIVKPAIQKFYLFAYSLD